MSERYFSTFADGYDCPDCASYEKETARLKAERDALLADKERLDWLEEQQVTGEWIYHAIHWDGRRIRAAIDAAKEVSGE